jgi:hypothetical protein
MTEKSPKPEKMAQTKTPPANDRRRAKAALKDLATPGKNVKGGGTTDINKGVKVAIDL